MDRFRSVLVVLAALLLCPALAFACPFCGMQGQTLTKEVSQASFVLFGTLTNAKLNLNNDGTEAGTTDLLIEDVVKSHPFVEGKKTLVLPRYLPVDKNNPVKLLVFCDFFKDRVDPYRGLPVRDKDIVTYLKEALALKDKDVPTQMAFFFNYLDHPEVEISTDAYREFANADGKDVEKMVATTDRAKMAERVVKWLRDKDTPSYRYGLYGYLLGLSGTAKDADVLVELLNDPQRGLISGIDGVLAGYVTLRPKDGWQYLLSILGDSKREFTRRYAALRAVRFFWDSQPEKVSRKELLAAVALLLEQSDIADLAIEDLRRWKQWELADKVFSLYGKESHNIPIIHRAILRFALSCPSENKRAAAFVQDQRRRDPDKVRDIEELLKLDEPPKTPTGSGS